MQAPTEWRIIGTYREENSRKSIGWCGEYKTCVIATDAELQSIADEYRELMQQVTDYTHHTLTRKPVTIIEEDVEYDDGTMTEIAARTMCQLLEATRCLAVDYDAWKKHDLVSSDIGEASVGWDNTGVFAVVSPVGKCLVSSPYPTLVDGCWKWEIVNTLFDAHEVQQAAALLRSRLKTAFSVMYNTSVYSSTDGSV